MPYDWDLLKCKIAACLLAWVSTLASLLVVTILLNTSKNLSCGKLLSRIVLTVNLVSSFVSRPALFS